MKRADIQLIPQPHNYDCQATCIAMACGGTQQSVDSIYESLCQHGAPGDPSNINAELTYRLRGVADVSLNLKANLMDINSYLADGAFLIIQAYTTPSGHVFGIKGRGDNGGYTVLDVWSEFNASTFEYDLGSKGFVGEYSQLLMYSTAVTSYTYEQALLAYEAMCVNDAEKGAWVHIIRYHEDRDTDLQEEIAALPTKLEATRV